MMWKISTAPIREEINYSFMIHGLFSKRTQSKKGKGTQDKQYKDKYILKETKTMRKNPAILWID